MTGYLRIGNKRAGSNALPNYGDTVMDGDRKNPILGNPFILKNHNDERERTQVIEDYRKKYEADWETNGPMRKETEALAARIAQGEKITAMCWCKPRPCHLDLVQARIKDIVLPEKGNYEKTVAAHLALIQNHNQNRETPLF